MNRSAGYVVMLGVLACGSDGGRTQERASSGTVDAGLIRGDTTRVDSLADARSSSSGRAPDFADTPIAPRERPAAEVPPRSSTSPPVGSAVVRDSSVPRAPRVDTVVIAPDRVAGPPPRADSASVPREAPPSQPTAPRAPAIPPRPFSVGERLSYEVRFGPVRVGTATMELGALEDVRGQPAYHAVFRVRGGNRLYRVNDHYESWFSAATLASLRYVQDIDQGSYERMRRFDIFPERRMYHEEGKPAAEPSVAEPLDDASFLYFLRTVPLEIGRTFTFERYFRPDRNPVTVRVLRRERVKVPAGEFDAIVVQPIIKTPGIFSEGGRAEVWFADDSTRRIVQIKSRLKFGSINLQLR
jgi:Protein of unknown function (DUF3108)